MIASMSHTGFVVRDLDQSLEFYRSVLELEVLAVIERNGGPISQVVGYPDAHLRAAHLSAGEGHVLELIQYHNPPPSDRPTEERSVVGASHLAFNVDDIKSTYEHLVAGGALKLNPPVRVAPDKLVCYLQDPDGNWIELVEMRAER